jgi:hypothetical protein
MTVHTRIKVCVYKYGNFIYKILGMHHSLAKQDKINVLLIVHQYSETNVMPFFIQFIKN